MIRRSSADPRASMCTERLQMCSAVSWGYRGYPRDGWRSWAHAAVRLTPALAAAVLRRADQVETVLPSNGCRARTGWACCCRHKAGGGGAPGERPFAFPWLMWETGKME